MVGKKTVVDLPLTEDDGANSQSEYLRKYIYQAVKDALKENSCGVCPIPAALLPELGHLHDALKSVGDGDVSHGIERFRENNRFIMQYRKLAERIGSTILKLIVMALFAGIAAWASIVFFKGK